jgi:hypothetical protein
MVVYFVEKLINRWKENDNKRLDLEDFFCRKYLKME